MTEPTAEALAWLKREQALAAEGVITGAREICRECLRPVWAWGNSGAGSVPACVCGTKPLYAGSYTPHGLDSIDDPEHDAQTGTTTYG